MLAEKLQQIMIKSIPPESALNAINIIIMKLK